MDFKELMNTSDYDFLRTNPHLGKRVILLGLGGSHAYGTNNENSDIDFRGITLNQSSDLLGLTKFEQYDDPNTDTVIYSFNKVIPLFLECNPNTIEMLGLDEEQYFILTPIGRELLEHKSLFLSKRAIKSFGGYAGAQLRRLQNAIARDAMPQTDKEQHIFRSVKNALEDFNLKNSTTDKGSLRLYIDDSDNLEFETEIFVDAEYKHMPLRDYNNMFSVMTNVIREYDKIGKRNKKKDDNHLNKHAMHLIRLFMMAIDIVEKGEIRTHRTDDLELLRSIRRGDFQCEDKTYSRAFFELLSEYENRLAAAAKVTKLPEQPDMEQVGKLVERINRLAIEGAF